MPVPATTADQRARLIEALALVEERKRRLGRRLFHHLFPDEDAVWRGPTIMQGQIVEGQTLYARRKYARHLEFFDAGAKHSERCFMAANRVGKTFGAGGYEMAAHLTGLYPHWWTGRRFDHAISAWAAGDTYQTTRDILQLTLLGEVTFADGRKRMDGRGVVPGDCLGEVTWHQGIADLVDTIDVRHVSGEWSTLGLKSYDQGRKVFQGTAKHVIWLDEEPPVDVYGECLIRTMTTHGLVILTFTPLLGLSEVVMSFLPEDRLPRAATDDEG